MHKEMDESSDAEESMNDSIRIMNKGSDNNKCKIQSFTPSTPPPTSLSYRTTAKRRKGVPHRSPTGGFIIEY